MCIVNKVIKIIKIVIYKCSQKARVSVTGRHFQPNLMVVSKAIVTRMKHLCGAPLLDKLLALLTSIRIGLKGMKRTNIIAFFEHS